MCAYRGSFHKLPKARIEPSSESVLLEKVSVILERDFIPHFCFITAKYSDYENKVYKEIRKYISILLKEIKIKCTT